MATKNQNFSGKQRNDSDTSFGAAKIKNDKPVKASAMADKFNKESQRPTKQGKELPRVGR